MKRHIKTGLLTAVIAALALSIEYVLIHGFATGEIIRLVFKGIGLGLLVGVAVYYMDRKD
jgi:hypothetical protein